MDIERTRTGMELRLYELARKVVEVDCDYKLYDVEYISGSSTLRVFIMDPETKTAVIEDCVKVDRGFTPYCEEEEWIPEDFVLEVSSPGMYRDLKTMEHFELALGQFILCHINPADLAGEDKERLKKVGALTTLKLRGRLENITPEGLNLNVENDLIELPFKYVKKANLDPEMDA